ncbi:MAG: hypothetical protein LBV13_01590 [Methanomassiliicoccaceae archaeon]|jgi:lysylphosphatidylglycerol synthetase-like protein (DUF2156 family)|nr:hypothetical protein [Methanomassiliicoccaceae archaeon]
MAQRPTFLSIICILLAISGLLLLLAGIMVIASEGAINDALGDVDLLVDLTAIGAIALIAGLIALVVTYMLWKGIKLGWYLVMVYLIILVIFGILSLPAGILSLIVVIVLIWYFFRPNVKEFFGI